MKIAFFDPIGGASGDMIVASLVDAGASVDEIRKGLEGLGLHGFSVEMARTVSHQIAASQFLVHTGMRHDRAAGQTGHAHSHHPDDDGGHHPHRNLADIERIISSGSLPPRVRQNAQAVFRALGEAEAKVHGTTVERIHFHEVGAVDSIVDITAACLALELLGVEKLYVGPLPLSRGTVKCAHGEWPVPGPATSELLRGFRWRNTDIEGELVTPTAAAIFAVLGDDSSRMPPFRLSATGYGAGANDYGIPNVLRVCLGDPVEPGAGGGEDLQGEEVLVVETSLDDETPEMLGHTMELLLQRGALDVWFTPVQMKKNRPGVKLSLLCDQSSLQNLINTVLTETSTLGVRYWRAARSCLQRRQIEVETIFGTVRVKAARLPDGSEKMAPEYDDVHRLAAERGVAAREVYREAMAAARSARQRATEDGGSDH